MTIRKDPHERVSYSARQTDNPKDVIPPLQYIHALAKKYLLLFPAQTKLLELSILHGSFNQ